jgi:alginate O-acetyltransferase complex protein AlgI
MAFNSLSFACFFALFLLLYWMLRNRLKAQNALLLLGSTVFYAFTDWRFVLLLFVLTGSTFILTQYIQSKNASLAKWSFRISLLLSLVMLLFFKYYNFFVDSFESVLGLHPEHSWKMEDLLIPVGISFFTFRVMGYTFDVKNKKIEAETSLLDYANYVSFFPSLLSGPIDKYALMAPQLKKLRSTSSSDWRMSLQQFLWGAFKKWVIADNIGILISEYFMDPGHHPSGSLWLALFLFAIQLYADFSGYSDMAMAVARALGFKITRNFDYPFFAENVAEFWRKWHMSLSSWLTEYVFTPLNIAFRDYEKWGLFLAVFINFTLCGMWHGAGFNYLLYGMLHGLYFIPIIIQGSFFNRKKKKAEQAFPSLTEWRKMIVLMLMIMFSFILFRTATPAQAWGFFRQLFTRSLFNFEIPFQQPLLFAVVAFSVVYMLLKEWKNRNHLIVWQDNRLSVLRLMEYYLLVLMILFFQGKQLTFIYMQF